MIKCDVVGQRFGRLVVVGVVRQPGKDTRLKCVCDCGGATLVLAYNVKNGNTSSCGCASRESRAATGRRTGSGTGKKNATHGMSKTPTYAKWLDARKRCFSVSNEHYPEYGGRGVTMCDRWASSFEAFLADMGVCPAGLTLEREDVNGNYEPGNCRWATKLEQARNKRRVKATWDIACEIRSRGVLASTKELANEFGLSEGVVWHIRAGTTWKVPAPAQARGVSESEPEPRSAR